MLSGKIVGHGDPSHIFEISYLVQFRHSQFASIAADRIVRFSLARIIIAVIKKIEIRAVMPIGPRK